MARKVSAELAYVDSMLCLWSDYTRRRRDPLSYPSENPIYRVMKYGPHGAHQSGPITEPEWPLDVALTERAFLKLGEREQKVLREEYGSYWPQEVKARRCNMKLDEYKKNLRMARVCLSMLLNHQ